jgi:hypothetical protein
MLNKRHLYRVLTESVAFFNRHQGLDQRSPLPLIGTPPEGDIQRRDIVGGIIHDYGHQAAGHHGFRILRLPLYTRIVKTNATAASA